MINRLKAKKMKRKMLLLTAFMVVVPALCLAQTNKMADTLKVIDKPRRVIVTETDSAARVRVIGLGRDRGYLYEYVVKPGTDGKLVTEAKENGALEFKHPFKCCATVNTKPHFIVFSSDLYVGWGRMGTDATYGNAMKKSISEFGVLNLLGIGYEFNQNRSRLSLGVGFNWSHYWLNHPYVWTRSGDGVVGISAMSEPLDKHHATLTLYSMQFPLMFNQHLGKKWNIAGAVVMNWNYYADFHNRYSIDVSNYGVTTRGLYQRKLSFDYVAMLSWHGIGAYFRYAPQNVFKSGFGPEMKNRWMLGIVLRGLDLR